MCGTQTRSIGYGTIENTYYHWQVYPSVNEVDAQCYCDIQQHDTCLLYTSLGEVLGKLMSSGHSVKLKGIGTFYYPGAFRTAGVVERPDAL